MNDIKHSEVWSLSSNPETKLCARGHKENPIKELVTNLAL